VAQAAPVRRYGKQLQETVKMIGTISGAQAALAQLLGAGASSGAASSATGAASGLGASGTSNTSSTQDLQSFMSSLIQELRQSGAAAGGTSSGGSASSVAAASSGNGTGAAQAASHHHGHGGHLSSQLESMLQQLQGTSNADTGSSAVAALANSSAQNSAGNSLQASFARLMQDLKTAPGAGSLISTSA
jgi:hypothetical protein